MPISLITVIWSMIAAVCATLAGIYLLVWSRNHTAWANLRHSNRGHDQRFLAGRHALSDFQHFDP